MPDCAAHVVNLECVRAMKSAATQTALRAAPFQRALLTWYDANKRDLPWRGSADPYHIWVSEVMLQQTRVATVISYYTAFLRRFPDVRSLAVASEQEVLAVWSGLGYYRRARMLHLAAKHIVWNRDGNIPAKHDELRELPGVGRYTAAAIASIAFGEPVAVVDGNIERVILRLTGRAEFAAVDFWSDAQELLDRKRPGDFNEAMMELGAVVCLPQQPACPACPVSRFCQTRGEHQIGSRPSRKRGQLHYAFARRDNELKLVQRAANEGLMAGMWELPPASGDEKTEPLLELRHAITVTDYQVVVHKASRAKGKWITLADAAKLPLTGITRKVMRALGLLK
jgi:A/G-specific adenine glycosylase